MVTIQNSYLKVTVSSFGAELQSIVDSKEREWLWQGDPNIWPERAPILFPICGGLKDDCYILNNIKYYLSKHGFAKSKEWAVEQVSDSFVTFLLAEPDPGFPFHYEFRAKYELMENRLCVSYTVNNTGSDEFCYCMGAHEGFALRFPLEEYSLHFPSTEDLRLSKQIGNLVVHEETVLAENTNTLPLRSNLFVKGALIFRSLKSRSLSLECGRDDCGLNVSYPDFNVLILWTKPGARYLCIEPWTSCPDFTDSDGLIIHKPGAILLRPHHEKTLTHQIEFYL